MDDTVLVQIPVSPEAAKALSDEARLRRVGKLVSDIVRPASPADDPLATLIRAMKADARGGGLTDEEIEAELAEYNGENRI